MSSKQMLPCYRQYCQIYFITLHYHYDFLSPSLFAIPWTQHILLNIILYCPYQYECIVLLLLMMDFWIPAGIWEDPLSCTMNHCVTSSKSCRVLGVSWRFCFQYFCDIHGYNLIILRIWKTKLQIYSSQIWQK